ncbi:hypothetical protein BJ165DRAFT_1312757, partial [Panaeolus papilionaceus]
MTKVVNQLSAKSEIGAPMISLYLLGNPDHYKSHKFIHFYWQPYVAEARYMGISAFHDYVHRNEGLEQLCLYDWVRCFERERLQERAPDDNKQVDHREIHTRPSTAQQGKSLYHFKSTHPLHETHCSRAIRETTMRVVNFAGANLPRKDKGDREYYCCTMLCLFKPWRSGLDLKASDQNWDDAFAEHLFTPRQLELMQNFNIRYECHDARDDYRAQMKAGATDGFVGSWE